MSIANGLIASMALGASDFSEDVLTLGIQTPNALIDVSALDLVGFQRIIGRRDCSVALTGRVSTASPGFHSVFSPATNGSVSGSLVVTFTAGPVLTVHVIAANYDLAVDASLGLVASVTCQMDTGVAAVWS